jgi:DNA polymerase-3 subunit delta
MVIDSLQLGDNLHTHNLYFLFGNEPLLITQSTDSILNALQRQGYSTKVVFDIDARFNFSNLNNELVAGDLFSSKKIIRLNVSSFSAKITTQLEAITSDIKEGVALLIVANTLPPAQQKSAWFKSIIDNGVVVNHKEIYPNQMQQWVLAQMQNLGLKKNPQVAEIIARNNESNVLSAFNELQKLKFIFANNEINTQEFIQQNKQNSMYRPYHLIDTALLGNSQKVMEMFKVLKMDNNYLCSLLITQVKQLIAIHLQLKQNITLATAFKNCGVWSSKEKVVNIALKKHSYPILQKILLRLGRVDRSIKGLDTQDPQQELLTILLAIAGVKHGLH